MISIEVEADNVPPFYLLTCFSTANAYNHSRTHRVLAINYLVPLDFADHYGESLEMIRCVLSTRKPVDPQNHKNRTNCYIISNTIF